MKENLRLTAIIFVVYAIVVSLMFLGLVQCAGAAGKHDKWDIISSAGMGYKDFSSTSYLARSACSKSIVVKPSWPANPRGNGVYNCGGDNPVYVGYPIAIEREFRGGVYRLRIGWWHQSQWFDATEEIHMDAIVVEATINWSELRRRKK